MAAGNGGQEISQYSWFTVYHHCSSSSISVFLPQKIEKPLTSIFFPTKVSPIILARGVIRGDMTRNIHIKMTQLVIYIISSLHTHIKSYTAINLPSSS